MEAYSPATIARHGEARGWREGHEHDAQIAKGPASHPPSSIAQHESTSMAENLTLDINPP